MINPDLNIITALLLGLIGSSHCIGMCGGIASALGLSTSHGSYGKLLAYNFGRISSYALIAAIFGSINWLLYDQLPIFALIMRLFAALLLIFMGFYIAGWSLQITRLEHAGQHLWRKIQPLGASLLPIQSWHQALLLGLLWGWLPCGLIYSTLLWTSASGSWQQSALLMFAFGLGTLPAMLITGAFNLKMKQLLQRKNMRLIAGIVVIALGLWSAFITIQHHGHGSKPQSQNSSTSHHHH